MKNDPEQAQRLARQSVIYEAIKSASGNDKLETANDLICICIRLLAENFPGELNAKTKRGIRDNYPNATDALMRERAMSPEGIMFALALSEMLARIALDYSPDSNFIQDMEKDNTDTSRGVAYGNALENAYEAAVSQGMSVFGASTTMVLAGIAIGGKRGLGMQKLARPLIDGLLLSFNYNKKEQPKEGTKEYNDLVDKAVAIIAQEMGISKAAARRYADYVEQQRREGKL